MQLPGRLEGKSAFITAAGQGMGRAAAEAFAREGALVRATDVDGGLPAALQGREGIRTRVMDVTDAAAVQGVCVEVGTVDVLCNCAGYVAHGNLMDCSEADWGRSFDIDVKSMYRVTRALLPGMLAQARGPIDMGSIASSVKGLPNRLASDESSFATGAASSVDGGMTI